MTVVGLLSGVSMCVLLVVRDASGQVETLDQAAVHTALTESNLPALVKNADDACSPAWRFARSRAHKIASRADSARAAVACGRAVASAIVGQAAPDRTFQVRELMSVWLEPQEREWRELAAQDDFLGMKWGVGLGISAAFGTNVDEAEIVEGTVRIKSDLRYQPRVLLEFHKFVSCNKNKDGGTIGTRGCGPFVAAAATDQKLLSGVGFGLMYGVKSRGTDSDGFSIGIGVILDGGVRDLGEGFHADSAPPPGETVVRYRTRGRWSSLVFITRTF